MVNWSISNRFMSVQVWLAVQGAAEQEEESLRLAEHEKKMYFFLLRASFGFSGGALKISQPA